MADENETRWSKTLGTAVRSVLVAVIAQVVAGVVLALLLRQL